MRNKISLPLVILGVVALFSVILAMSAVRHLKKVELDFNSQKNAMTKEITSLKSNAESLQWIVDQKTKSLDSMAKDMKTLEEQVTVLRTEGEEQRKTYDEQIGEFKRKNVALKKRVGTLEEGSLIDRIREALFREENPNVKRILEDSINRIEMIRSGKSVSLQPIVVTKGEGAGATTLSTGGKAIILSVDKRNNLIVINAGRKDNVKEGDRCSILKGGEEIASAEIISVRYRIAAAFVDDVQYKHTIRDVKEGYEVVLAAQ